MLNDNNTGGVCCNKTQVTDKTSNNFVIGNLVQKDKEFYLKIKGKDKTIRARRAVSCLVVPQSGDKVLAVIEEDNAFILAVLQKENNKETKLFLKGNATVVAEEGIKIVAGEDIMLGGEKGVEIMSPRINLVGDKLSLSANIISFTGQILKKQFQKIKAVAKEVEKFFVYFTRHTKNSYKYTTEHDEIHAGSARYLTEKTMTIQARDSVHLAEELITMNAKQINLC